MSVLTEEFEKLSKEAIVFYVKKLKAENQSFKWALQEIASGEHPQVPGMASAYIDLTRKQMMERAQNVLREE